MTWGQNCLQELFIAVCDVCHIIRLQTACTIMLVYSLIPVAQPPQYRAIIIAAMMICLPLLLLLVIILFIGLRITRKRIKMWKLYKGELNKSYCICGKLIQSSIYYALWQKNKLGKGGKLLEKTVTGMQTKCHYACIVMKPPFQVLANPC